MRSTNRRLSSSAIRLLLGTLMYLLLLNSSVMSFGTGSSVGRVKQRWSRHTERSRINWNDGQGVLRAVSPESNTEMKMEESTDVLKKDLSQFTNGDYNEILFVNDKAIETEPNVDGVDGNWGSSGLLWRGVVFVLCALWASNFASAKLVMNEGIDSGLYAVSRFGLAALALIPGSIGAIKRGDIDWKTAKASAICGGWVAFGYLGQTVGLLTTTASKSCVICSLHCVFVAILSEMMRMKKLNSREVESSFDIMTLLPATIAVLGVAIIELKGAGGDPNIGDLLSFAQPIGFGLGYVQLENIMKENPGAGLVVSAIKLLVVAMSSFLFFEVSPSILHNEPFSGFSLPDFGPIIHSPLALGGILYTGLITTALALWVESIAFKRVPATDASIILTSEPLFAALAGSAFLGETFGVSDYIGATLIIGACIIAIINEDEATEGELVSEKV